MLSAVAWLPESLLREKGISLAQVYIKAASFCGFYPITYFRPYSSLSLTPDTQGKYPGSPCPDATNRLWWCRRNPRQLFQSVLSLPTSKKSHQKHSGISLMLPLKPPLSTLQLSLLFWLPPTYVTADVKLGMDPSTPALAQQSLSL